MFLPDHWPGYYKRARGVEVWDLDGRRLIDMSVNGVGACLLGAADPDVDAAVIRAIRNGSMSTLNCPEEVELAGLLCELHPWAARVRLARGGGEAMAIAVRLARAATGRQRVAFCGYHGWHDWYLAANLSHDALDGHLLAGLEPAGVPAVLAGTALPFQFNQAGSLQALADSCGHELAAIVLEPLRSREPQSEFLAAVRRIATRVGAVLILDEITVGWRFCRGGAHLKYDLVPDVAVFAKALGNGFPIAAVIGIESVLDAAQRTFISSTSWSERVGPAAALAAVRKHCAHPVPQHLERIGRRIQDGWSASAAHVGLPVRVSGPPALAHLSFEGPSAQAVRTLFTQEMLDRGFLAGPALYVTYAHHDAHVDAYLRAVAQVFEVLARAQTHKSVEARLRGPVAHSGFQRLT
jgi:glutamate-1-semialdehyde 2,1-aminomutase